MFKKTILCGALILAHAIPTATFAKDQYIVAQAKDASITSTVANLYAKSSVLKKQKITVKTDNHEVYLSGSVATLRQYQRAITLAESVNNVSDVNTTHLYIKKSKAPLKDISTTAKVKGIFLKEKLFGGKAIKYWPVSVDTKNNVVYLSGKVDTIKQRDNLIKLTQNVKGITKVESAIVTD